MQVTTVGLDLAKDVFQVHGVTADGTVVFNRSVRRAQLLPFFEKLPPCLVGMEACGSSHHWAREISKLGHEVRLMPAFYVKPYVKRGKTDGQHADKRRSPCSNTSMASTIPADGTQPSTGKAR